MLFLQVTSLSIALLYFSASLSDATNKRELPLSYDCNPNRGTCYKGDLIAESLADCEKDSLFTTCNPINDYSLSTVVDVPDVSKHGVNCVSKNKPITCGAAGTDTRCVCYKAVDYKKPKETLFNQCRCQYWPDKDVRMNQPSYCTQFDHGGASGVHFYTCCNNCNDDDSSCDGRAYQGGGTTGDDYCAKCGQNSASGSGRITYRFSCGSCNQQSYCQDYCDKRALGITMYTPGLCPAWAGCFRGCCVGSQKRKTRTVVEVEEFCGDFSCQDGENHTTCPTDCCPAYNPEECSPNTCNPECCYEPNCCGLESSSYHDTVVFVPTLLVILTMVFGL